MRLLSAKRYGVKLKATIQASGKLGFPKATSDILRFSERPYVYFLLDDNEEDLYMVLLAEGNEDASGSPWISSLPEKCIITLPSS